MRRKILLKVTSALLFIALVSVLVAPTGVVRAAVTCYDDLTGTIYDDCPPEELLEGMSRKDRSAVLEHWKWKLDSGTKEAYREYVRCRKALPGAEEQLARAKAEKSIREVEYERARDNLKRLLVAAMARLGVGTAVISVDAAANLYLAGKSLKEAIAGSQRKKSPEELKAQQAEAAEQQRLVSEAAKRQQYGASLETDLAAAEQKVAAAEARRSTAAAKMATRTDKPAAGPMSAEKPSAKPPAGQPPPPKPFSTKEMNPSYKGEQGRGVKYFTEAEREAARLHVRNGKIYDSDGNLFDTTGATTAHSGEGRAIFVMDEHGNLYATNEQIVGEIHHSSLSAGKPVAAAGEIEVVAGEIRVISNKSGHYTPSPELTNQALERLNSLGVDTSGVKTDYINIRR